MHRRECAWGHGCVGALVHGWQLYLPLDLKVDGLLHMGEAVHVLHLHLDAQLLLTLGPNLHLIGENQDCRRAGREADQWAKPEWA